tara:strand:+ start:9286 stop:10461 length:1176 start_codon:yes stop_codon:yes gene_type:complete
MNRLKFSVIALLFTWIFSGCNEKKLEADSPLSLIDEQATSETKALYQNLKLLEGKHSMFGHQATLAYGYTWRDEPNRSDVKDVTGSFPALYGWDIADFLWIGKSEKELQEDKERSIRFAKEGFERGGVITFAWHMPNPVTEASFYDTTRAVHAIIPGGEKHEEYKTTLDSVASFFKELAPMPVIFRPFHEHNGDWFWWGKGLASEEDYITLWQFTVDYLKDEKDIHNLIWAFSPDRSRTKIDTFKEDYFYGYPGDEYVDIIGLDNYWDVGHPANETPLEDRQKHFIRSLAMTAEIAQEKNKIAALTETGLEAIPDSVWWTQTMLKSLMSNEMTKRITYVQVWRNATKEVENRDHYYAPYPGQISAKDFQKFKESEFILFEDELPNMYEIKK